MTASAGKIKAVFLDRDSTLNVDRGYTHKVEDFAWMPGAPEALALFHRHGVACFIVTNQGGIGKGLGDAVGKGAVGAVVEEKESFFVHGSRNYHAYSVGSNASCLRSWLAWRRAGRCLMRLLRRATANGRFHCPIAPICRDCRTKTAVRFCRSCS